MDGRSDQRPPHAIKNNNPHLAFQHRQVAQNEAGDLHNGHYTAPLPNFYADLSTAAFDDSWALGDTAGQLQAHHTSTTLPVYGADVWNTQHHLEDMGMASDSNSHQFASISSLPPQQAYHGYPNSHQQLQPLSVFDPALAPSSFGASSQLQSYPAVTQHQYQHSAPATTIAPDALANATATRAGAPQRSLVVLPPVNQRDLISAIPKSTPQGIFRVIDDDSLLQSTNSVRMSAYVNIGNQDLEYPVNKAVIPVPPARRSRNELRTLAANDPKLLAKLGKRTHQKSHNGSSASALLKKERKAQALPRPIATLNGVKYETVSSGESSSESDSSDYDSDDEPPLPNPLPAVRPDDDAKQAVRYDTIKALWRPQRSGLPLSEIRTGLKEYWEIVKTIRDRWKNDQAAVQEAEDKGRKGELPLLKSRVRDQRSMIEVSFKAALEHGHRSILELLSENVPFLFVCYQFLAEKPTKEDVDGSLPRSILGVIAMCDTLTTEKLTKVHLSKVLPFYLKKGKGETQELVKKIEAAAKTGSEEQTKTTKGPQDVKAANTGSPSLASIAPESTSGVKRQATTSLSQPAKRVAGAVQGSRETTTPGTKPTATGVKRTLPVAEAAKPAATAGTVAPKAKPAASKPSSFFNVIQPPVKKTAPVSKPAVSVVAAAVKSLDSVLAATAGSESTSSSGFSFADTMANLHKPKERAPSPKQQGKSVVETEAQKNKRLRKEARRGLRVTFRTGSELEQIKYFTHDANEDLGHDSSMTKDLSDVGGEGRMLKQHRDMMEVDEEEEEEEAGEEVIKPFKEPAPINFDDVDSEERDRNFAPFGGGQQKLESQEKIAREQYEAKTLMVFFPNPNDVPPTPKEPIEQDAATNEVTKAFGAPQAATLQRAEKLANPARGTTLSTTPDLASILAVLTPQPQTNAGAQSQPASQNTDFHKLFSQTSQGQQPQTAAAPATSQPALDLASLFASITQPQQQQAPPATQQQQQQQANSNPDWTSLMSNLQPTPTAAPQQPMNINVFPGGVPAGPFGFSPAMMQQAQQMFQQPQQQQQTFPYENEERRRMRENGQANNSGGVSGGGVSGGGGGGGGGGMGASAGGKFADKRFTLPCKYWSLGKCQKGDKCTYLHT